MYYSIVHPAHARKNKPFISGGAIMGPLGVVYFILDIELLHGFCFLFLFWMLRPPKTDIAT